MRRKHKGRESEFAYIARRALRPSLNFGEAMTTLHGNVISPMPRPFSESIFRQDIFGEGALKTVLKKAFERIRPRHLADDIRSAYGAHNQLSATPPSAFVTPRKVTGLLQGDQVL